MKLTISVTQGHINRGEQGSCGYCPVALAVRDALELEHIAYETVSISMNVLVFGRRLAGSGYPSYCMTYTGELPHHIFEWIKNFDKPAGAVDKKVVHPFVEDIFLQECVL